MTDSSPDSPPAAPDTPDAVDGPLDFDVVLRGYDRAQVQALLETMQRSIAAPGTPGALSPAEARDRAEFDVVLRGYDRAQVRAAYDRLLERLSAAWAEGGAQQWADPRTWEFEFDRAARGYDPRAATELVDSGLAALREALSGGTDDSAARTAAEALRRGRAALPKTFRGYNTGQVDFAVDTLCAELERAEPAEGQGRV
ncbi:hypothetical protein FZ103_04000 [Streptomonospora sp. PA3]|uniref:hypothetical protein n=1 Tax=Streptomonospora sp. PA3 TaxID=2607326 RepID=UPI0012DDC442|nr:hypothetical protein [Streptomonospora sp. PA3]MUL40348.1 hypothetical protein [Streptomonospora sp. PA3]